MLTNAMPGVTPGYDNRRGNRAGALLVLIEAGFV